MRRFNVTEQSNKRIDKYVCEVSPYLTRSAVQRMIREENILVNGHAVKASYVVCEGDIITAEEEIPLDVDIKPQEIPLDIIYEDDDILIINKEKGMVVHPRKWK
ncbi:MAG: S4 domain-containing protein [Firmicutes bacterium]|nr:S4 domain-containing protein [Bacillota bacterium]